MHRPRRIHVYICPDPGPWPHMKPCMHTFMGPQSYTCTDTETQAHVHTMCTHLHTHAHAYRIRLHKHPDPGPWTNMHLCVHTHSWAPMSTCTQMPRPEPVDKPALMHIHIHGCQTVHMPFHHGPGSWAFVHSCTHMCAFMSPPLRGHEHRHPGPGPWKYL